MCGDESVVVRRGPRGLVRKEGGGGRWWGRGRGREPLRERRYVDFEGLQQPVVVPEKFFASANWPLGEESSIHVSSIDVACIIVLEKPPNFAVCTLKVR